MLPMTKTVAHENSSMKQYHNINPITATINPSNACKACKHGVGAIRVACASAFAQIETKQAFVSSAPRHPRLRNLTNDYARKLLDRQPQDIGVFFNPEAPASSEEPPSTVRAHQ